MDVDLETASISVQRTLQRIEKEWKFMEPKTKSSRRTITVPGPVVKSLREHRARQAEERLRMGANWQGDQWGNLIFANKWRPAKLFPRGSALPGAAPIGRAA